MRYFGHSQPDERTDMGKKLLFAFENNRSDNVCEYFVREFKTQPLTLYKELQTGLTHQHQQMSHIPLWLCT